MNWVFGICAAALVAAVVFVLFQVGEYAKCRDAGGQRMDGRCFVHVAGPHWIEVHP